MIEPISKIHVSDIVIDIIDCGSYAYPVNYFPFMVTKTHALGYVQRHEVCLEIMIPDGERTHIVVPKMAILKVIRR